MRLAFTLLTALACLQAMAADEPQPEIRFCPADVARTYPLDSRGRMQSLLAPHIAIINRTAAPFTLDSLHLELLREGQVVDMRRIDTAEVQRFASNSAGIQQVLEIAGFVFCGTDLVAPGIKLAGPVLQTKEGLIITNQVFAFDGKRDTLRVRAAGTSAGSPLELIATLPLASDFPKTDWLFPVRGISFIGAGPSLHTHHRSVLPEAYALDIVRLGASGVTYRNKGTRFSDYYGYGTGIYAAAAGKVVQAASDIAEDPSLLQRPDESTDAYTARVVETQAKLLQVENGILGNHVILDHGNNEYSVYAHLQPGSVRVRAGQSIAAGALLGRLGSSGNSTEPHLHFQVCQAPQAPSSGLLCNGVPVMFKDIKVMWAERDRALQSGDVVVTQ